MSIKEAAATPAYSWRERWLLRLVPFFSMGAGFQWVQKYLDEPPIFYSLLFGTVFGIVTFIPGIALVERYRNLKESEAALQAAAVKAGENADIEDNDNTQRQR